MQQLNEIETQLRTRNQNSGHIIFKKEVTPSPPQNSSLLLTCSSDTGVWRNGGRRGANFAPEAIMATLKKCVNLNLTLFWQEISSSQLEEEDFSLAQQKESQNIFNILKSRPHSLPVIELGGGHDHIYPLLKALRLLYPDKKMVIFNLDAHLDTRIDSLPHSGTPFRQFLTEDNNSQLYQIGIHRYTNLNSNFSLPNMQVTTAQEIHAMSLNALGNFIQQLGTHHHNALIVTSLDLDVISAAELEAVSAVNYDGLTLRQIKTILHNIKKLKALEHFLGLYEFNPLFDNLSQKGARTISALILEWILPDEH